MNNNCQLSLSSFQYLVPATIAGYPAHCAFRILESQPRFSPERHKTLINRIPFKTSLPSKWPVRRFKLKDERDSVRLYGPAWVFIKGLQEVAHSPFVSYYAFVINFIFSGSTINSTCPQSKHKMTL